MDVFRPPIETDPDALEQIAHDYLRSVIPAWEPVDGDLTSWLIAAHARMIAEERDIAADVPFEQILRPLGEKVHRIPPRPATPASVNATVHVRDRSGYTVPAGLEVLIKTAGDEGLTFAVVAPVVVPRDEQSTRVGEVLLRAVPDSEGAVGNGYGPGYDAVPIRSFEFIERVELTTDSSGGADGETDEEYLERLVETLALTSPVPILPDDFAQLALQQPGVKRALALNLYDPADGTWDNPRTVSIALVTETGDPISAETRRAVVDAIAGVREINWVCHVIEPTWTRVVIEFEAVAWPGYDDEAVTRAAIDALADYISPARWGTVWEGAVAAGASKGDWVDEPVLRYLEVAQVLNGVVGLRYVTQLKIAESGGTPGTADVALRGPAALPAKTSVITGNVREG